MKKCDIIILDSGIDNIFLQGCDNDIEGFSIVKINDTIQKSEDFNDEIGHGTAVYSIVKEHCPSAKILNIKLFDGNPMVDEEKLIYTLNYIAQNIEAKIINLSLSLPMPMQKKEIKDAVDNVINKGITIVAAYDNSGCLSYPAAFENVIGVSSSSICRKSNSFLYIENSLINILAYGNTQRIHWLNGAKILSGGNSFACAHFTGILYNIILNKNKDENIFNAIKRYATSTFSYEIEQNVKTLDSHVLKKTAIYPFNKEMHSLIRYEDMLCFDIVAVYDNKYSARVGAGTSKILNNNKNNHIIRNIENICWDEIDSIIIGHTREMNMLSNNSYDLLRLINDAAEHHKNIYSFDKPQQKVEYNNIYYPELNPLYMNKSTQGKLYRINKPVLCVIGTSSCQGKFSLQLSIRKKLLYCGYSVGQLGTEPTSPLFNLDECFHFGYDSNINLTNEEIITYVNSAVNSIANQDNDIIISGCQSETLHHDCASLENYTLPQISFLAGLQPDALILVINPYDEDIYIKRVISFVESFLEAKVLGIVIYPMTYINEISGIFGGKRKLSNNEINELSETLRKKYELPVCSLDDIDGLINIIIEYFS